LTHNTLSSYSIHPTKKILIIKEEWKMARVEYTLDDKVAIITMNDGENRFNLAFLDCFLTVLDEIENNTDANSLIVTSAHEKIFCNGIDLDWLAPFIQKNGMETAKAFFYTMMKLFKRILLSPMPTMTAISGHVFAGGYAAAGFGIAIEKRWGHRLGIAITGLGCFVAPANLLTIVKIPYFSNSIGFAIISLMFDIALFSMLVHPSSRSYAKIWFS